MRSWQASTAFIIVLMVATFAVVGGVLGFVFSWFFTGGSWWRGGSLIFLAIGLLVAAYSYLAPVDIGKLGAERASPSSEPRLYGIVEDLTRKAGTRMPAVYVIEADHPNAFAIGRSPDKAAVAATRPLMDALTDEELEGVMAHELSHIIHRDTIVNGTARNIAKALTASAFAIGAMGALCMGLMGAGGSSKSGGGAGIFGLIIIVVLLPVAVACLVMCLALPSASAVMRFGVSRSREYGADESAARITGRPMALASALMKLERGCSADSNWYRDATAANLWTVNPFGRYRKRFLNRLMDTHPSTADRVRRLEALDRELSKGIPEPSDREE